MFLLPFLLSLVGLVIGSVGGVASVANAESSRDMILLEPGTQHCYIGSTDLLRARIVNDEREVDGILQTLISVVPWVGWGYGHGEKVAWNPERGVEMHGAGYAEFDLGYGVHFDPPRLVLPAEMAVGFVWTNDYTATCDEDSYFECNESAVGTFSESFTIAAHELVQVPFGEFMAYRVVDDQGHATWYAAGVGVVKVRRNYPTHSATSELVSTCPHGIAVETSTWGAVKARF